MRTRDARLIAALDDALEKIARAQQEGWELVGGGSAQRQLELLAEKLCTARANLRTRGSLGDVELSGLVRWVADWIPDLDDPLLKSVGKVERAARS